MSDSLATGLKQALVEKLADSLSDPFLEVTPRRVFGDLGFPGKASAIIGMRRSGKTYFLHQIRKTPYF